MMVECSKKSEVVLKLPLKMWRYEKVNGNVENVETRMYTNRSVKQWDNSHS